jgi:hypothetical protein
LRGAIIFVAAFLIFLIATIGYSDLPPGKMIYDAVIGAETDYQVIGVSATLLTASVFNGVIYGIIIWLAYTLAERAGLIPKRAKKPASTAT